LALYSAKIKKKVAFWLNIIENMEKIIGRKEEMAELNRLYNSDKPERTQRNLPKCGDVE